MSFFLTFFGAILASILELWGDQKSSILVIFRSQNRDWERRRPPFIRYMLLSALRTPKMCRKGPQNAPKMFPKCPQEASKSLKFGGLEPSSLPCYVRVLEMCKILMGTLQTGCNMQNTYGNIAEICEKVKNTYEKLQECAKHLREYCRRLLGCAK